MSTATEKSDTATKSEKVRLRYLGDKMIRHTLTGLVFTKHVMHEMSREAADDLLHWTHGEEFEEIK